MHLRHGLAHAALLSCVLSAAPGLAAPEDPTSAEALSHKTRGHDAFDNRRFGEALQEYQAALALGNDPRLHYNIAQALVAMERYPEALAAYQAFLVDAPPGILNEAQQARLLGLLDELKGKIAKVEVKCDVEGARVLVRQQAMGTTPFRAASVNAGPARVEVIAEGFRPFVAEVTLEGGRTHVVEAALVRVDFTGAVSVRSTIPATEILVDGQSRGTAPLQLRLDRGSHVVLVKARGYVDQSRTISVEPGGRSDVAFSLDRTPSYALAYAGFGVGAAGVIGGTVTGILAYSTFSRAKDQCDTAAKQCGPAGQDDLRASKNWGTTSTIAFGVGAAGIGLGVYGVLTARPARGEGAKEPGPQVAITPRGLMVKGAF